MLLLLLVCLMKLVDMSAVNRHRRYFDGGAKENRVQNGQQQQLTPEQYQQLRCYQQQQRQLQILQQQRLQLLLQHQHIQQQILDEKQQICNQNQQNCNTQSHRQQNQKQKQKIPTLMPQKLSTANGYNGKVKIPQRGMTEFPSIENQKSRLPQLIHNSSQQHHSRHQKKQPLTSPNPAYYNHNYDFNNINNQSSYYNYHSGSSVGSLGTSPYDELTDETLKKNVQIVLNNLDRYSNALRSIILNEQSTLNSTYWNNNKGVSNMMSSPESDFNSNAPHHPFGYLNCSIASSHDFTHDNSDYQWFLDYGYRDGVAHQSVLSSLSASYNGIGELSYYEDLARNIDANLAEVDMESFRAEDIHSLLTNLPSLCKDKRRQDNPELDNSICKSELLFSPVRESHISVDSLDLDSYPDDGDIILTCKANKDNYTIAFEGSAMYSDESFYAEPGDPNAKVKQNFINLHSNLDDIVKRKSLEVSMSRSDHAFTTWSKLKKSSTSQLQRYPSGNNNTSVNIVTRHAPHCIVRKSSSLPNLRLRKDNSRQQLNVSQAISTSTVDSFRKSRNLLPMCQMPISSTSGSESPVHNSSMHSTESSSKQNQPAFNLVKLFIKQKSSSSDTCMDVSSGCWPSDASSSLEQRMRKKSMNDSGKGSALSRHDEEEDGVDASYQLDSLDICDQTNGGGGNGKKDGSSTTTTATPKKMRNDLYREVFDSSTHRHNKNQPLKNPQLLTFQNNNNNNNNSMERDSLSVKDCSNKSLTDTSRTSENLTQVFCNNHANHESHRMKIPVDMVARSIQTSMLLKDKFRVVPPSFLAQLNKLGEERRAPVYVIYPNYALPDLGFVKTNLSDVILSPLGYKENFNTKKRPTSITSSDEETLKNAEYKHVIDWKSLVMLLPTEYRRRLKNIPEADVDIDPMCSQRPLFCMTPPLRRNVKTNTCDCASYLQTTCTSSSGSSQPPSSGYRGSSTLLTDSEFDSTNTTAATNTTTPQPQMVGGDPMSNMYVYQYENTKIENDVIDRPPPSGRTPRGILRRNTRSSRSKRNSMFEEGNSPSSVKNLEKRRSLQEPYYWTENHNIIEEYLAEIEEHNSKQYYKDLQDNSKVNKTNVNYMMEINSIDKKLRKEQDLDARARAENFLSSVPKSELKYYAEVANILESMENTGDDSYDRAKLKNEVSRALSQKKVSFNQPSANVNYLQSGNNQKFSTPPNSPNISMAALRVNNNNNAVNNNNGCQRISERKEISAAEKEKQDKISSNRFKRLQIQWELLSKDSSVLLKDLASDKETKSGGSTPTSTGSQRSRIPRPVSYPATKVASDQSGKQLRSPSRIVPPKKYHVPSIPPSAASNATQQGSVATATVTTTRPRTPSKLHNTPKKTGPSPRPATRTR